MKLSSKTHACFFMAGALSLGIVAIMPAAHAGGIVTDQQAIAQASTITKQQAEAIALKAVGGGKVVLAVLEKEDHSVHWSIDIVGANAEHEVWVSTSGKVLRIITQPL